MSHAIALPPPMTVAGFDAFLAARPGNAAWEPVDGQILAMPDPSLDHAEFVGNVSAARRPVMPADRRCRVAARGVPVQGSDDMLGVYAPRPDVMVWCGSMDGTRNFVTMPMAIIEVLRPSSMDSDRGAKLRSNGAGRPTLYHIALVHQDQMRVETYRRTDTGWELDVLTRPGNPPRFGALLFEIPLAEVYAGVALPAG